MVSFLVYLVSTQLALFINVTFRVPSSIAHSPVCLLIFCHGTGRLLHYLGCEIGNLFLLILSTRFNRTKAENLFQQLS